MSGGRWRTPGLWALRVPLAAVFAMAGANKLAGDPMMIGMFGRIGFGQGLRYLTGAIEVAAALLVLWPRTSLYGAVLTLPVLAGALVTQLAILHGDIVHVLVLAALAAALAWVQRPDRRRHGDPAG